MKKKEPWRILVGVSSIICIIFLWARKDFASACAALSPDRLIPVIVISVAITSIKVIGSAAAVFLIRWLIKKFKADS